MPTQRKRYLLPTPVRIGNNSYGAGFAWLTDDEARQAGLEVESGEKPPKDQSKLGSSQALPGGAEGIPVERALAERGVAATGRESIGDNPDARTRTDGGALGDTRTSTTKGGGKAEGAEGGAVGGSQS